MALLNANYMGLYVYDTPQTSPWDVYVTTSAATTAAAAAEEAWDAGAENGDFIFVVKSDGYNLAEGNTSAGYGTNDYPLLGTIAGTGDASTGFTWAGEGNFNLMAAATNTSLEVSRSIDEIVAKGTQCESETYTSVGASSWSLTCDGLIQDTISAGQQGASTLIDTARDKKYVIVRFVLDVTDKNGTDGTESEVNYWGQGFIESVNVAGTFDATQTYTATIRGYGNLYRFDATGTY